MNKMKIDWDNFEFFAKAIQSKLEEEEKPALIVGLSRGGLPLATLLSNRLNVAMVPLEWSLRDNPVRDVTKLRNILEKYYDCEILLVDDLIDSGKTYLDIWMIYESWWRDLHKEHGLKITPVVMFHNTEAFTEMPYWNKPVSAVKFQRSSFPNWFVFPWE